MSENQVQPALYDVKQVATLLSCSTMTVRRLADAGRMPRSVHVGNLLRWNRTAIDKWIANGCPRR